MIKTKDYKLPCIPQSLILDNPPYFKDLKINTRENIILNNQEIKDTITERISPFGTHSTLISLKRSQRPQPTLKDDGTKQKSCLFDNLDEVAKPQRKIGNVYIAPNPFAFNPGFHDLIITNEHIENIEDIEKDHIRDIINVMFQRAKELSEEKNVININMGINFGTDKLKFSAGASQPHLHSQIGAIFNGGFSPYFALRKKIEESFKNIDYTGEYIKAIKSSCLDIKIGKYFILFAPFAPRFKDEIHILPLNFDIPNLISVTQNQINELISFIYLTINSFKGENNSKLYIPSFNIIFEGANFNEKDNTRIMISIIPRQSEIAYSELSSRFVIDKFPEDTAKDIKEWIQA